MFHFRVSQNYNNNHNEIQITQMLLIIPDWRENKFPFPCLSVSGYIFYKIENIHLCNFVISSNNIINNSRKRFYNANNNKKQ